MASPSDPDNDATRSLETITQAAKEQGMSRRNILSATAVGASAMAFSGAASAFQQDEGNGNGSNGNGGSSSSGEDDGPSNVEVLNYALTLEHLENEFYNQGFDQFSDSEIRTAETLCAQNEGLNEDVPQRLRTIGEHEQAHVDQISAVIEQLGGEPVDAACYEFGLETPSDFLQVAMVLENTGVSAYNGAIKFFNNDKLATAGATIATVEARHASFLNSANQGEPGPFPRAFDQAKSMEEILEAAGQFIVECEDN